MPSCPHVDVLAAQPPYDSPSPGTPIYAMRKLEPWRQAVQGEGASEHEQHDDLAAVAEAMADSEVRS